MTTEAKHTAEERQRDEESILIDSQHQLVPHYRTSDNEDVSAHLVRELLRQRDELAEALRIIAGGWTDKFPGAPDIMKIASPESFRSEMWSWDQRVAADALAKVQS